LAARTPDCSTITIPSQPFLKARIFMRLFTIRAPSPHAGQADEEHLAGPAAPGSGARPTLDGSPGSGLGYRMLEAVKKQLQAEVEALNHELSVTLPASLKKAIQNGDLRENGDYHAALERQHFVQARLSQLRSRLTKLSHIDLTKIPTGRVGLGSRVTVQDMATGQEEKWEIVIPDAMDIDRGHISVSSPLGRGLVDKEVGDVATVQLPAGTRKLKILGLRTLHDQVESGLDEGDPGR